MISHVHHTYLFASNIETSLKVCQEMFGEEKLADLNRGGSTECVSRHWPGAASFL